MDYTIREIDTYARGVEANRRSELATMLWAAREGAVFNAHAFAGKRIPNIDRRLRKLMQGGKVERRNSEVADVIATMNAVATKAGMPPPRPRARKPKDT